LRYSVRPLAGPQAMQYVTIVVRSVVSTSFEPQTPHT
jgi:hypothetical protein